MGLQSLVHDGLPGGFITFWHDGPAHEGMGRAIHGRYDEDPLFFCPSSKVRDKVLFTNDSEVTEPINARKGVIIVDPGTVQD